MARPERNNNQPDIAVLLPKEFVVDGQTGDESVIAEVLATSEEAGKALSRHLVEHHDAVRVGPGSGKGKSFSMSSISKERWEEIFGSDADPTNN